MDMLVAINMMHEQRRENVESAVLAAMLRKPKILRVFLKSIKCKWPHGAATTRCEVRLGGKARGDIEIEWTVKGKNYYLLVENKPYDWLQPTQPTAYVDKLDMLKHEHQGLVLLTDDDAVRKEWTKRLRRRAKLHDLESGEERWGRVKAAMKRRRIPFNAYRSRLSDLCADLKKVNTNNPDLKRMLDWFCEQHIDYQQDVAKAHQRAMKKLVGDAPGFQELVASGLAFTKEFGHFGVEMLDSSNNGKSVYLWMGVEPDLSKQLEAPSGSVLLQVVGWPTESQRQAMAAFCHQTGLAFQSFQSADRGNAKAAVLTDASHVEAAVALRTAMGGSQ